MRLSFYGRLSLGAVFTVQDSKERFSSRVEDYNKYRPSYPPEVITLLKSKYSLNSDHTIADIGSGTGISSELFLKNGNTVYAIEPNQDMRLQAERNLTTFPGFKSINGQAEATTLAPQSADFIVAAQAFHWFNLNPTRAEFHRIKKPSGFVVVLFNDRLTQGSEFAERYEQMMNEFGTDYKDIEHKNREIKLQKYKEFFKSYEEFEFPYSQHLNYSSLLGRTKSSSYTPKTEHPEFLLMQARLESIFKGCAIDGLVDMKYVTQVLVAPELRVEMA